MTFLPQRRDLHKSRRSTPEVVLACLSCSPNAVLPLFPREISTISAVSIALPSNARRCFHHSSRSSASSRQCCRTYRGAIGKSGCCSGSCNRRHRAIRFKRLLCWSALFIDVHVICSVVVREKCIHAAQRLLNLRHRGYIRRIFLFPALLQKFEVILIENLRLGSTGDRLSHQEISTL